METILQTAYRILEFVIALGVLIFLHEFGHYIMCKIFRIEVEEFGFGFPPRLIRLFKFGETEFTLNWIPFGAFVRPKGENDPSIPGSLAAANPWKRFGVLVGGPLMNLITAVILFSVLYSLVGAPDTKVVQIVSVNPNAPAEQAGLLAGDTIISVNGVKIEASSQLSSIINTNRGKEISITYRRDGQDATVQAIPRVSPPPNEGALGIVMSNPLRPVSFFSSIPLAVSDTAQQAKMLISMPVMLITGQVSGDQARLVGPKGMYDLYQAVRTEDRQDQAANPSSTPVRTLNLIAAISVALGITNLLPIPALDGGRILFLLPEILFRKRVPPRYETMVHLIGFAALILLMVYVTAQDFLNPILIR